MLSGKLDKDALKGEREREKRKIRKESEQDIWQKGRRCF